MPKRRHLTGSIIHIPSGVIKVSMLVHTMIHTHTNPWGRLKWPYAITRLTANFMCGLMSDLLNCRFRKTMVTQDNRMPLLKPGVIKQHKPNQIYHSQILFLEALWLNESPFVHDTIWCGVNVSRLCFVTYLYLYECKCACVVERAKHSFFAMSFFMFCHK